MEIPVTWTKLGRSLFWILCLGVALASLRFLVWGIADSMDIMLEHAQLRPLATYLHILLAPLALALMPFQFRSKLRLRRPAQHRWMGRIYAGAILLAGFSGLWLAATTTAGPVAGLGFGLLALLWLGVTGRAVQLARHGEIEAHRRWMIRSAALTFAAVSLRLQLPVLIAGFGFDTGYSIVAWSCWLPTLLVAELVWLRRPLARGA